MKFASFENIVAAIYNYLPGTKDDYGKGAQTLVAFSGGYMAGILCAIVSHPADVMVSKLNADRAPGEGFGAAMSRIYGKIGFGGLWNGLPVRIVMIGTLTGQYSRHGNKCAFPILIALRPTMDDLRLLQDLRRTADNWQWWRKEGGSKSLIWNVPGCKKKNRLCVYEYRRQAFDIGTKQASQPELASPASFSLHCSV